VSGAVLERNIIEERDKEYDKYDVPVFIRRRANRICDTFAIENPTDTLYIANIIAKLLGCGNGHNVFKYKPNRSDFYESNMKALSESDALIIREKIISVYNESFYDLEISNEVLMTILMTGTVPQDTEWQLLKELMPLVEKEMNNTTDGWWKNHFSEKLDALKRRAIDNRFAEAKKKKRKEIDERLRNYGIDLRRGD
jgi:hypothetical protein